MHPDADRLAQWLGQVALRDERAFAALYRATSFRLLDAAMLMMKSRGLRLLTGTVTSVGRGSTNHAITTKKQSFTQKAVGRTQKDFVRLPTGQPHTPDVLD